MSRPGRPLAPGSKTVILDSTALLKLGAGNQWLSEMLTTAKLTGMRLYAPALCLTAAVAQRPLLADHIGGLDAIDVLDLTYSSASAAGTLIADGTDWQHAHAVTTARPTMEWPDGRTIITTAPQAYSAYKGVSVLPVP